MYLLLLYICNDEDANALTLYNNIKHYRSNYNQELYMCFSMLVNT